MTELTFAILKYGFLILLWVFVWLAIRGLHNDVTTSLARHSSRHHGAGSGAARRQPQVLVGGSGESLLDDGSSSAQQAPARPASAQQASSNLAPVLSQNQQEAHGTPDSQDISQDIQDAQEIPNVQDVQAARNLPTMPVEHGAPASAPEPADEPEPDRSEPARRPLSGTSAPVPISERRDVLGSLGGMDAMGGFGMNPGQDNASESADLASLVAGVASEKREKSDTALPKPTMLTIIDGPRAGTTVNLEGSAITLGRAGDNTVVLDDEYVSGHHCRLVPNGDGQWRLEDLHSTNGTYVNESRLLNPAVIPIGTSVRIGATTFTLR